MTLLAAIDKFMVLNPNLPYTEAQLTEVLNTVERMIQTEIMNTYPFIVTQDPITQEITRTPGTLITYDWEADQAKTLLLSGTPFEDIYGLYLASQVFYMQGEWTKYANAKAMFNARYMEAQAYFCRTETRVQEHYFKNFW